MRGAMPGAPTLNELRPMLLCERKTIPPGRGWLYEIKYDGYRMLATTGEAPRLKSKNGADATTWFPELIRVLAELPPGYILDGEVCVLDDIGRSDFERLHRRARRKGWYRGADPVAYCVFDLLVGKGNDFRGQSLERRKAALQKLIGPPAPGLLFVDSVGNGAWLSPLKWGCATQHIDGQNRPVECVHPFDFCDRSLQRAPFFGKRHPMSRRGGPRVPGEINAPAMHPRSTYRVRLGPPGRPPI